MNRCAIYARFSSEMQKAASLDDQIRNCRRYAQQRGWEVLDEHIYQDAALSGFGVEHRPAYQRMVAAALSSEAPFTAIVVDDLSRLSRDLVETLRLYRRLNSRGVEIVSISDGIQTSHQMAKLQITIKGLVNELYLDDLRDKTHRGMTGRALKGFSTGGRLFGYRTDRGPDGVAWRVDDAESAIVRRIFSMYLDGLSMKAIAIRLNNEGVGFPAKTTRRGPDRRGWAVSTIHTILLNRKYVGDWVWNKTIFVKNPETGKRNAVARPQTEWLSERRPDLAIVTDDLWNRVEERLQTVRAAYGGTKTSSRPQGRAPELHSPHLLSGLMRCGHCGARITVQSSVRKKASGRVYRYGRYRCSFHVAKGPSICANAMSIRQEDLEARLIDRLNQALTPQMIDYLVEVTNLRLGELDAEPARATEGLQTEGEDLERELANLVDFIVKGGISSARLNEEIRTRERRLAEINELMTRSAAPVPVAAPVDRAWIEAQMRKLADLLATDPLAARREVQKHVEDLRIAPAPEIGPKVVRITGRAKADGLLGGEEAVRLQLVAGAGFEPATFGL